MRVGVARNFTADGEVTAAFNVAVEVVRGLGHELLASNAPLDTPPFGDVRTIEADRKAIARGPLRDIDLLLLPTTATTVPAVDEARADPQKLSATNTVFANYFGLPAISVPCGFDGRGLPIGLQIVAKAWDDHKLLRLAQQFQRAARGHERPPRLEEAS
jgi:aspartyl-tRNA(Asn)/glutamyl-tRNA(Gln) amidotransferase subunit A